MFDFIFSLFGGNSGRRRTNVFTRIGVCHSADTEIFRVVIKVLILTV